MIEPKTGRDADPLSQALGIKGGVIGVIGAGGKKTLIYHLASCFPGRVGITTTTNMCAFPPEVVDSVIVSADANLGRRLALEVGDRVVGFARPSIKRGRFACIAPEEVAVIHEQGRLNLCLVKADGARGRLIKAPAAYEPVLPTSLQQLIPVVSARALGRPLSERIAHRPDRVAAVCGLQPGTVLQPLHFARLLTSVDGLLKAAVSCRVTPVINMVDEQRLEDAARAAAVLALGMTDRFDSVALCSFRRKRGLVELVTR